MIRRAYFVHVVVMLTPINTGSPALTVPDSITPETTHPTNGTEKTSDMDSSKGLLGSNLLDDVGLTAFKKHSEGNGTKDQCRSLP
jgi:hypothetical protein